MTTRRRARSDEARDPGLSGHRDRFEGLVFDMDGVILNSEGTWHEVRRDFVAGYGGRWVEEDQRAVMGANSRQWAEHIRGRFDVPLSNEQVIDGVVRMLQERYRQKLPLLPGATEAVGELSELYPLAVASSSPKSVIEAVLEAAGLADRFAAYVSSDEVEQGKPSPDVYLLACERLGVSPSASAAIEDSANGIKAAESAGLMVVAVPNPHFPPDDEALGLAARVVATPQGLTPELFRELEAGLSPRS